MSTLWVLYKVDIILPQQQMNGMMDKKEGRVEKKKKQNLCCRGYGTGNRYSHAKLCASLSSFMFREKCWLSKTE